MWHDEATSSKEKKKKEKKNIVAASVHASVTSCVGSDEAGEMKKNCAISEFPEDAERKHSGMFLFTISREGQICKLPSIA